MKFIKFILSVFFTFCSQLAISQLNADFFAIDTIGCDTLTVKFTDQSTGGPILLWNWAFGDGNTDTIQNPSHFYDSCGVFTVTLTVIDASVSNTIIKENYITVRSSPVADFTDTMHYAFFSILFTSQSQLFDTSAYTYYWNFGDNSGDTTDLPTMLHNYNFDDNYTVSLVVSDEFGCSGSITKYIVVKDYDIEIPNIFTPNGDEINDVFFVKTDGKATFSFTIYNRWGTLIYTSCSNKIIWDGRTSAGVFVNTGTYYYIITSDEESPKTGAVQLVR